jgi:hypothetical protein
MSGAIKLWERKVILGKIETTEGTDAAPVVGTDAFQVLDYQPQFMDADNKVRNIERAYFGAKPVALTGFRRGATFSMEMHGGGTANGTTVPPWMRMNRVCGFDAGVVTGGNSVVQTPITDSISSLTHWAYLDDLLMKTVGSRGSVGFVIEDDEIPRFNYRLLGRAPSTLAEQAAPGSPTITGYTTPMISSSENTTFSLDGFALALRRWEMDTNADLQFRSLIGPQDRIQYRQRGWAGSIVGRLPDVTAKDYFAKIRPGTTMAATCVHGVGAGNIVTISAPALQITGNVELSEEGGEVMITLPVTALPVGANGNDELVFTTT